MGKARGVSKNFLSSSSSSLNAMSPNSPNSPDELGTILSSEIPNYLQSDNCSQFIYLPHNVNYEKMIVSPSYIDNNEWIASNVIGLFENVNNVYEAIYDLCACNSIQTNFIHPDERGKRVKQTARQYLDGLLSQCYEFIESDKIFPKKFGDKFPNNYRETVATILRNLLQCIIHLYLSHFEDFIILEFVPHLNSITKHLFLFTSKHGFIEEKCFDPVRNLYELFLSVSDNPS